MAIINELVVFFSAYGDTQLYAGLLAFCVSTHDFFSIMLNNAATRNEQRLKHVGVCVRNKGGCSPHC